MDDKKFLAFLKALGKDKKPEDETIPKSRAEIKARTGKTFYEIWMERGDDEREKL